MEIADDIVLFLRDSVPRTELIAALSALFGIDREEDDPLIVSYSEGFATGVGMTVERGVPVHDAASALASRLGTTVLVEAGESGTGGSDWLLFSPGCRHPLPAQPVELRSGLTVTVRGEAGAVTAQAAYA